MPKSDGDGRANRITTMTGAFAGLFFSYSPFWVNIQGVMIKDISADLGFSRTQVSSMFAISMLTTVLAFPIVGRVLDLFGPRRVIIVGACTFPIALLAFSRVPASLPIFGLIAMFAGLSGVLVTPVTYLSILPRWFDRRLGVALGFASMGVALGQAIVPLIVRGLSEAMTWRGTYVVLALTLIAIAIPNAVFMIKDRPLGAKAQPGDRRSLPGMTLVEAAKTGAFWQLNAGFILMVLVTSGLSAHFIAYLTDRGVNPASAALTLTVIGITSLLGRGLAGYLLDRFPLSRIGFAFFLGGSLAMLLLGSAPATLLTAFAAAVLIGAAAGAEGDFIAMAVRRQFGLRAYGNIFATLFAISSLGAIAGPILMALSYDRLGSYRPMMLIFSAIALVAALLILWLRPGAYAVAHDDIASAAVA